MRYVARAQPHNFVAFVYLFLLVALALTHTLIHTLIHTRIHTLILNPTSALILLPLPAPSASASSVVSPVLHCSVLLMPIQPVHGGFPPLTFSFVF